MNCSKQTGNGTTNSAKAMATLLQQKNCMKTLTVNNSVVMVNAAATNNGNVPTTTITPNGTFVTTTGNHIQPIVTNNGTTGMIQTHVIAGQSLQTAIANQSPATATIGAGSRVLLPHEMGTTIAAAMQQHQQQSTFQFQQLQTTASTATTTHQQPQFILYNPHSNDVTMLRTISTSATQPISNAIFHHQATTQSNQMHPHHNHSTTQIISNPTTFITQNSLPKSSLGAIQFNNNATTVSAVPISFASATGSTIYVDGNHQPILMTNANNKTTSLIQASQQPLLKQTNSVAYIQHGAISTATPAIASVATTSTIGKMQQQQNGISSTSYNNRPIISPNRTQANDISVAYTRNNSGLVAANHVIDSNVTTVASTVATNTTAANAVAVDSNVTAETRTIDSTQNVGTTASSTNQENATSGQSADAETEAEPEIDIVINNVVCSFSVRCHLNLREIALKGHNVEYRRENGMVTMKLRRPYTTASVWSSGRITCTGATSEDQVEITFIFG